MAAHRQAEVTWEGDLMSGNGRIGSTGSGVLSGQDVTWASRSEPDASGRTSPEELLAAAHATCFSMALSHGLAQAGTTPERIRTSARSTFVPGQGITKMELDVAGRVSGLDEEAFRAAAEQAKENCPVSGALRGNVEITLNARLES